MKRIVAAILMIMLSLSAFAGAEPLVTLATISPAMLYMEEMRTEYDLGDEWDRYALSLPVSLPFLVEDSGISFDTLFFGGIIDKAKAAWDAAMIAGSLSDIRLIEGRGTISILPDISLEEGRASVSVIYDDAEILYSGGGWMDSGAIDGRTSASVDFKVEPLLTLSVDADNTLSGTGVIELSFSLDEEKTDEYLGFLGMTRSELRSLGLEVALYEFHPALLSLVIGVDIENASEKEVIEALSEEKMLDLLDCMGLLYLSSDTFSMCVVPTLMIDGSEPDIDMRKVMKDTIRLIYLLDEMY